MYHLRSTYNNRMDFPFKGLKIHNACGANKSMNIHDTQKKVGLPESHCCLAKYCKRNIRGTLIFADFAQNSASANSKTCENICDILYAHFGHVGVVYIDHVC